MLNVPRPWPKATIPVNALDGALRAARWRNFFRN
jgi:hypothetical protein